MPILASGIAPATWDTSLSAAVSVIESKDTQRAEVEACVRSGRTTGHTDDEVQVLLGLDGNSVRPRRWELWKLDRVVVQHDGNGEPLRRMTRSGRMAVVWVTPEYLR